MSGVTSIHAAIGFVDNIGLSCYNAFAYNFSTKFWKSLIDPWYTIPTNILYNLGNMWVNTVNLIYYTPSGVPQGDWAYFVSFTIGDFLMRFIFNANSFNGMTNGNAATA